MENLKRIKDNLRYNIKLGYSLNGKNLKILLDAITELNPSADFRNIKAKKSYNKDLYIPLSGIDVKNIVDALLCPIEEIKFVKGKLRYNTKFEYVLTGQDIKIIIDSLITCELPPPPLYWYATFQNPNQGDQFTDWTINGEPLWENASVMQALGGGSVYWISGGTNHEAFLLWVVQPKDPTDEVRVLDNLGNPVALSWGSIAETTCRSVDTPIADPNITVYRIYTDSPTGIDAEWMYPITPTAPLFDDPQFEVEMDAIMKALNGPQATFTIAFGGGNVRMLTTGAYANLAVVGFFVDPFTITLDPIACP